MLKVLLMTLAFAAVNGVPLPTEFDCSTISSGYYRHWLDTAPLSPTYYYVQCNTESSSAYVTKMTCPGGLVCYSSGPGGVYCGYPPKEIIDSNSTTTSAPTPPPTSEQKIPGGIAKEDAPMLIYFSIDDALTPQVYDWSRELFRRDLKNPNNCSLEATFNIIETDTKFDLVKKLFDDGFEMASHSVTHRVPTTWWETATKDQWKEEIAGMRDVITNKTGISPDDIRGMRSPFLVLGESDQFDMLSEEGFAFDNSMVTRGEPVWPFKLTNETGSSQNCTQHRGCPKKDYPDLWEIPLNPLLGCNGPDDNVGLSMVDACRTQDKTQALDYLRHNFYRHYNHPARPPFGLNMHFAWFSFPQYDHNLVAMKEFLAEVLALGNVWLVTSYQVLQWMESPTTHAAMMNGTFTPVNC